MSSLIAEMVRGKTTVAKVLGQSAPTAGVLTQIYKVPGNTNTVVTGLKVCNQDGLETDFRVSVAVAGEADARKQYQYYDTPVRANDTLTQDEEWTLGVGDVIRVQSGNGLVSFTLYGLEIGAP